MAERGTNGQIRTRSNPKSSDWFNFAVAFIATMCAVWAPRVASVLLSEFAKTPADLFDQEYVLMSVIFGIIVSVVIMFQKWEKKPHPWSIFVGALAVPSLLAGVFNSTAATYEVSTLQGQIRTIQLAAESSGSITFGNDEIRVFRATGASSFEIIDDLDAGDVSGSLLPGWVVSAAYAQSSKLETAESTFYGGLNFQQPQSLIVLDEYETKDAAISALGDIRENVPYSRAVKMGEQFFIVESTRTRPFAGALEEAIRLRDAYGYSPAILSVGAE